VFNHGEQTLAGLLAQDLSNQIAQGMHIVTQAIGRQSERYGIGCWLVSVCWLRHCGVFSRLRHGKALAR
jgi:hypothetical protein